MLLIKFHSLTSSKWNQLVNIAETNSGKLTGISNSNGTLTATAFVGDGSSLTNLPAGSSVFAGSIKIGDDAGAICDANNGGAVRYNDATNIMEYCNKGNWGPFIIPDNNGSTKANAGTSCYTLKSDAGINASGTYWIDPNGGSTDDAFEAYCDMTTDGGGWTLVVGIDAANANHVNANAVGTLTSLNSKGKFSDSVINSLNSGETIAFRLTCGTFTQYRPSLCVFAADQTASTDCSRTRDTLTGADTQYPVHNGWKGLKAGQSGVSDGIVYSFDSAGCYASGNGGGTNQSGKLFVR